MEPTAPTLGQYLQTSSYILILLGAGISAPSGVPTFKDLPPSWRGYSYAWLSSPTGFEQEPAMVWMFYESLRQTVLRAQPNRAHASLAQLARMKPWLLTISQNIDDLCQRAGHLPPQLVPIHGSLFTTACSRPDCPFTGNNYDLEPIVPSLVLPTYNVSDSTSPLPPLTISELPHCPLCKTHLLRPGVVRYGELLAAGTLDAIDAWLDAVPQVDLMLVIGTSGGVSTQFIEEARAKGAPVAHFNSRYNDEMMGPGDWFVPGDVAVTLPRLLEEVVTARIDGVHG